MLVIACCVLGIVSPFVAARWPAGLLLRRWRWAALLWGALVVQVIALQVPMPEAIAAVVHILTYVAAAAFLWLNRDAAGVLIAGAGAVLNGLTIALNGGTLPASAAAAGAAGIGGEGFENSAVLEDPVLPWLGDVFAWPEPMPLANTFSVGDVLIVAGVWVAAWAGSRRIGRGVAAVPASAAAEQRAQPERSDP